jgi:hypothetical protein
MPLNSANSTAAVASWFLTRSLSLARMRGEKQQRVIS